MGSVFSTLTKMANDAPYMGIPHARFSQLPIWSPDIPFDDNGSGS
jgi:hypothetical protein